LRELEAQATPRLKRGIKQENLRLLPPRGMGMARIAGVDLPRNKRSFIALTYIYGIGQPRATRILEQAKVDPMKKVQDLGEDEVNRIRQVIEGEGMVEGDLRKDVSMSIKRLIEINSYRGFRHRRNLPVRGQRTHTNARTRKGPRKGTVAQKRKSTAKT
jgi:small subunit ribosomal protein S13